jgi:hypothetical protein
MNQPLTLTLLTLFALTNLSACRGPRPSRLGETPGKPAKTSAEKAAEKRSIAPFEILEGTPYRVAHVIESEADRWSLASSGYGGSNTRNYIFLNAETKDSAKLLPNSDSLFVKLEKIVTTDPKTKATKVEALWYQVIRTDTNGDQKLDTHDKSTIATSTIAGTDYTELIPQVDRVLNIFQAGPTKILMVYELDRQYFVTELDLGARKVVETKALPSLE